MDLRIAICDDEENTLTQEAGIIKSVLGELKINSTISLFNSSSELIKSQQIYDIVFLDIEMGETSGIQTAKTIRTLNKDCYVFFITNYSVYLDEALNQRAFRFWTKPLDRHKLIYGIQSVIDEIEKRDENITVTVNNQNIIVYIQNIIYIYTYKSKIYIVTTRGEISSPDRYREIHGKLKKYGYFCESQRAHLVNFNYVRNYNKDKVVCTYKDKTYEVYISRRKYNSFNQSFLEWVGGK